VLVASPIEVARQYLNHSTASTSAAEDSNYEMPLCLSAIQRLPLAADERARNSFTVAKCTG
jgi:hypothetical protein